MLSAATDAEARELLQLLLIEARAGVAARIDSWRQPRTDSPADPLTVDWLQRCVIANLEWVQGGLLELSPGKVGRLLERVRRNRLVEVRCCCRPQKLLGWLELPRSQELQAYQKVRLVKTGTTRYVELELRRWVQFQDTVDVDGQVLGCYERGGLAFYSDDTPIDELRQVPAFIENRGGW